MCTDFHHVAKLFFLENLACIAGGIVGERHKVSTAEHGAATNHKWQSPEKYPLPESQRALLAILLVALPVSSSYSTAKTVLGVPTMPPAIQVMETLFLILS